MKVKGTISDRSNNETIVGAVVFQSDSAGNPVKGGKNTTSDVDGNYSIDVPENSFLTARMVSYTPQTINVGKVSDIDFGMKQPEGSELKEVVVTAKRVKKNNGVMIAGGILLLLLATVSFSQLKS